MDLKFEFVNSKDAWAFGKNLSRNLQVVSKMERDDNKFFVIVPEKNLGGLTAATLTVCIVSAGLISGQHYLDAERFKMVVEAMQRANPEMIGMTTVQISEHLASLAPDQLQGIVNNTKGVYHEMLYVDSLNSAGFEGVGLHEDLNNPGADVFFANESGVIEDVQLKATNSVSYVNEHLEKYPEISLLATEEVAEKIDGVESSGFSNEALKQDVTSSVDELISSSGSEAVTESISSTVAEETIGVGPISIITALLFGIF